MIVKDRINRIIAELAKFGTVELYENPYHTRNYYLKLELGTFDGEINRELFRHLQREVKRPILEGAL